MLALAAGLELHGFSSREGIFHLFCYGWMAEGVGRMDYDTTDRDNE